MLLFSTWKMDKMSLRGCDTYGANAKNYETKLNAFGQWSVECIWQVYEYVYYALRM